jgi:choline dehydrogenase-like flavoprotein
LKHTIEKDIIIIGSGFGGSMTAYQLTKAGYQVAIIERGSHIDRAISHPTIDHSPSNDMTIPYHVIKGGNKKYMGAYTAVGGPSLYYGGVSFRFREKDFLSTPEIIGDSGAKWPIDYKTLSPYYDLAESILGVNGGAEDDPTSPKANQAMAAPPAHVELADITKKIKHGAESLGHSPFRVPLAINHTDKSRLCTLCVRCDTFVCNVNAKNDLATMILNSNNNIEIYADTIVKKINTKNNKVESILAYDKANKQDIEFKAQVVILSAGSLGTPHLLLNSELDKVNPAGEIIGRYLTRHINAITFGIFPGKADKQGRFHKELAIMDYYFGHKDVAYPKDKIGSLQQVSTPPKELVINALPYPLGNLVAKGVDLITGLLSIAEDQPQYKNHIGLDKSSVHNEYNIHPAYISHEYTKRDEAAIAVLKSAAKKIMLQSGAIGAYNHDIRTFSHSLGTARMGDDERKSAVDKNCNFRGLDNLFITDGSVFPTSGGVNPSLTIAANSLRVGEYIVNNFLKRQHS